MFLPRITLGKPASAAAPLAKVHERAKEMLQEAQAPHAPPGLGDVSDPKGFSYLKRDLVRLLGILSSDSKTVQDRVRACGGVQIVMSLCVVDERNPCKCSDRSQYTARGAPVKYRVCSADCSTVNSISVPWECSMLDVYVSADFVPCRLTRTRYIRPEESASREQ